MNSLIDVIAMNMKLQIHILCSFVAVTGIHAFSGTLFQKAPTKQRTAPSKKDGVDIELPDFDELFNRISQVSPLARRVIESNNSFLKTHKALNGEFTSLSSTYAL